MRRIFTILALWLSCAALWSQDRPAALMFSIDAGRASLLDTYLSPIRYKGYQMRIGFEHRRDMGFNPQKWMMISEAAIDYNYAKNPAGNHVMHHLSIDGQWNMLRKWDKVVFPKLSAFAGGGAEFRGGAIYSPINSNNPASPKIHLSLNLAGGLSFATRIGRMPITLLYRAEMPFLGCFFSMEYDESYYEIYKGNRKKLVNFGWWGNRFDMVNLVAADLKLGKTVMRIGYRGRIETSWVNNLNTQIFTHSLVIGFGGNWLNVK